MSHAITARTFVGLALAVTAAAGNPQALKVARIDALHAKGLDGRTGTTSIRIGQIEPALPMQNHPGYGSLVRRSNEPGHGASTGLLRDHATHVAGILVGHPTAIGGTTYSGVAKDANLQAAWWSGADGTLRSRFSDAMDWFLIPSTPDIVNMSAGVPRSWGTEADGNYDTIQKNADFMVSNHGKLFVAAAGNEGGHGANASTMRGPGAGFNVLSVGATGRSVGQRDYSIVANYSSQGVRNGSQYGPDLVAPGARIFSPSSTDVDANGSAGSANDWGDRTFPNNGWVSGTSFATPLVSGTAALLHEHGVAKGLDRDPMVMRAVLMNSANKNVKDSTGTRLDKTHVMTTSTLALHHELGTGQLDALRAFQQYDAGQERATIDPDGTTRGDVDVIGWDRDTITDAGRASGGVYRTERLQKGTYLTSTLVYEREVIDDADGTFSYRALDDLDLEVADAGAPAAVLAKSNGTGDTVEHLVYKTKSGTKHEIRAFEFADNSGRDTEYGIAWRGTPAPKTVREFNGGFRGERGSFNDNGWYEQDGSTGSWSIFQIDLGNGASGIDQWAMNLETSGTDHVGVSQELMVPSDEFRLNFEYAFGQEDAGVELEIHLGDQNLLEYDDIFGSSIIFDSSSIMNYAIYDFTFTDATLFDAIDGEFTELSFHLKGNAGEVFIDNIAYVPTPGALATMVAGLLLAARRRQI